jgi:prepilin-type processing-associated H-X9-DG protein
MLAESGRGLGCWRQAGPATVRGLDPANKPYIGPGQQFGGMHDGVAVIAMADGSVRVVSASVAPKIFDAFSTIAGGEEVPGSAGTTVH